MNREAAALVAAALAVIAAVASRPDLDDHRPAPRSTTPSGHENLVEALALAPDRDVLISSGWDGTVRFWDLEATGEDWGEEILKLPQGSHPYAVAPSPDGNYLAVGGSSGLTVWEETAEGWSPLASRPGADGRCVAFAPDSRSLVIGGKGGVARILAVPSLKEVIALEGLTGLVRAVAFSPDGARVAACTFGGDLAIWAAATGARTSPRPDVGRVHGFAFSRDGRILAAASRLGDRGGVTLWDLEAGEAKAVLGLGEDYNAVAFSPDGALIAGAGVDRIIRAWDSASGELRGELTGDLGWIKAILFTGGGARLAYGGRDGCIRFWDVPTSAAGPPPRAGAQS